MSAIMTGEKTRDRLHQRGGSSAATTAPRRWKTSCRRCSKMAEDAGYATGVISTARITHATPAATYAPCPNRNWEADSQLPATRTRGCRDIARQLVEFDHGDGIDVISAAGGAQFLPHASAIPSTRSQRHAQPTAGSDRRWLDGARRHTSGISSSSTRLTRRQHSVAGSVRAVHMQFEADRRKIRRVSRALPR